MIGLNEVIAVLLFVITIYANNYEEQIETYAKQAETLKTELEQLDEEYRILLSRQDETIQQRYPGILVEVKAIENNITNRRNEYFAERKETFRKQMLNVDKTDIEPSAEEYTDQIYEQYVKGTRNRMDRIMKSWDKTRIKNNKTFQTIFNSVNEKMTGYQNLMEPIRNKVSGILTGAMSPEQLDIKQKTIETLQENMYRITRQAQMDAFHEDEKQRSDGNSGIKQIRTRRVGAKNYHSNTHTGGSFSAIHDHSNNIRTVGMGEFIGVLNGVEFRTRHNDYRLKMPANDEGYHKTQDVEFPPIPKSVTDLTSVDDQAAEMREYFKAFQMQDPTHRDYRPYFKPLLVYLEGAWTSSASGSIEEPFESDRHHIDAKSWLDLQEKVRFTSYAGSKSLLENLAHLPTKIIRFTEDRQPVLAQWNYRILCHPIDTDKTNLELKHLKLVVDQTVLRRNGMDEEKYKTSRAAKFDIEGIDVNGERQDRRMFYTFLDKIMEQVPGKNNYGANIELEDELYYPNTTTKINAAYYHRAFVRKHQSEIFPDQVGFSDRFWVAYNTQDKVAAVSYRDEEQSKTISHKVSYAVPVEIIWLTPLHSWNPYNVPRVEHKDLTGAGSRDSPFNGYSDRNYFFTPDSFFGGLEEDQDPADTVKAGEMRVQTPNGVKAVRASGTRIILPQIEGVDGRIRQRYPIMPVFGEGSAVWKKLNAIEDAMKEVKNSDDHLKSVYTMGQSHGTTVSHRHNVDISLKDLQDLKSGAIKELTATSGEMLSHSHTITIYEKDGNLFVKECDGATPEAGSHKVCNDLHADTLSFLL